MAIANSITSLSDEAFGWYLSGLVDGEGSFILNASRPNGKFYRRWIAKLALTMRADETEWLQALKLRFGAGNIYVAQPPGVKGNPVSCWTIFKTSEIVGTVIPHFDRFPLQMKKARDYVVWRECALLLAEIRKRPFAKKRGDSRVTAKEAEYLDNAKAALIEIRKYCGPAIAPGLLPSKHEFLLPFGD